MQHPPTTAHSYLAKQLRLLAVMPLQRGIVHVATVAHDDWCDALHGRGYCNCDPDIRFTTTEGTNNN